MPNKAYAVLYQANEEEGDGWMYFPIKRQDQTFGGMPQFFGGTKNLGESDRVTITREMSEESDGLLSLAAGGLYLVHSDAQEDGSVYNFYVATQFTGKLVVGPFNNPEMQALSRFLAQQGESDTVVQLLEHLRIVPTEEFDLSFTYKAFTQALAWAQRMSVAANE
ncbi:hypothetical protein ACN1C3_23890 [Pseudomonas sp. H11T01]|uniref:hypothetical protein n=1 Tax=Pseudomonas sp. H11T01 TaxID=3402749 RepID=UPI003AC7BBCD